MAIALNISIFGPGPGGGMAVEVLDDEGALLDAGEWIECENGRYVLRITPSDFESKATTHCRDCGAALEKGKCPVLISCTEPQ